VEKVWDCEVLEVHFGEGDGPGAAEVLVFLDSGVEEGFLLLRGSEVRGYLGGVDC
jgi:hypothetical protein